MDIILEITDHFIADYAYAELVPSRSALYDIPITANASTQTFSTWHYKPATQYLYLEPSEAAYQSEWTRDDPIRQIITLYLITWLLGAVIYFVFATTSYVFVFDKRTLNHPKFIKNQIQLEIIATNKALPIMAIITAPIFWLEVQGYGRLYDSTEDGPGFWYDIAQFPFFFLFTDFCIYWVHRGLHHPTVYKHLHKAHHKWIMPTPFASHAFHPLDGFAQGAPYHLYPFLFPLSKVAYIGLFVFVNLWTIMIHDGEYITDNPFINGAACHSLHHSRFEVNYGQFFTGFDRMGGTYKRPEAWMFERGVKMSKAKWQSESKQVEILVQEIEGGDDRTYLLDVDSKKKE